MKYVYKIVGNFTDENMQKSFKRLNNNFILLYTGGVLYIALKSIENFEEPEEKMKRIFRPARDFYIEEINEQNIMMQGTEAKDWCLHHLVRLDKEKFEKEEQAKLKKIWSALDELELNLSELKNKKQLKQKGG